MPAGPVAGPRPPGVASSAFWLLIIIAAFWLLIIIAAFWLLIIIAAWFCCRMLMSSPRYLSLGLNVVVAVLIEPDHGHVQGHVEPRTRRLSPTTHSPLLVLCMSNTMFCMSNTMFLRAWALP